MAETSTEQQYPNLNPSSSTNGSSSAGSNAAGSMQNARDTMVNSASNAVNSIQNSQTMQNLQNGPMADKARQEHTQVKSEFSNLANSRQTPETTTATGQPLTHYHSALYTLLSWENPRATGITYAATVLLIFVTRYVPIASYALRLTWITLGCTALAELAGRMVLDQGVVSKMRPKKYYTIPRETLESYTEDLEQFINFFVIEIQRIVFAENVLVTVGAFFTALATYFLIKVTPVWGLTLLFTTLAYFVPLVYISNRELIDGHLENAGTMINQQTQQVRDLASQHTSKAMEMSSNAIKDYSNKASSMMGQASNKASDVTTQASNKTSDTMGQTSSQASDTVGQASNQASDMMSRARGQAVEQGIVSPETADKTEQSLRSAPSAPTQEPSGIDAHNDASKVPQMNAQ